MCLLYPALPITLLHSHNLGLIPANGHVYGHGLQRLSNFHCCGFHLYLVHAHCYGFVHLSLSHFSTHVCYICTGYETMGYVADLMLHLSRQAYLSDLTENSPCHSLSSVNGLFRQMHSSMQLVQAFIMHIATYSLSHVTGTNTFSWSLGWITFSQRPRLYRGLLRFTSIARVD